MPMRLTGLQSGMDTDTMVKAMTYKYSSKIDKAKGEQKKTEWKKEAWGDLNKKLYSFYTGALSDLKSAGTYRTKKATTSTDGKVSFGNVAKAVTGTHSLSVHSLAKAAYLTGAKISNRTSATTTTYDAVTDGSKTLDSLVKADGTAFDVTEVNASSLKITNAAGDELDISTVASGASSIDDMVSQINSALSGDDRFSGLTASFENGALKFTNSTATLGEDGTTYEGGQTFTVTGNDSAKSLFGLSDSGLSVVAGSGENATASSATGVFARETNVGAGTAVTGSTKLSDLGIATGEGGTTFSIKVGENTSTFTIDANTTVDDFAKKLSTYGVSANYDAGQGRFYIAANGAGTENDFELTASDDSALSALGLDAASSKKIEASDASVTYNGVTYTQSSNNFSINGMNFTAQSVTDTKDALGNITDNPMTISVENDTQAAYDKVKNFVKEYNELLEEMNKLYNAESAKDYKMLTDDERADMSDKDIENWDNKIKSALLRRDDKLGDLLNIFQRGLNSRTTVNMKDGTTRSMGLSALGIEATDFTENGKLHILGDSDDSAVSAQTNKLMEMLEKDPEAVLKTLTNAGQNMYNQFSKAMKSTSLSSALTFYNDKEMDDQIKNYKTDITDWQKKLTEAENKYYNQFAKMEGALSQMNSQMNYMSSMLG